MGYVHVEIITTQSPKRAGGLCGDVVSWERTTRGTTLVCCDGIGSGIRANVAATMTVSRLEELLRRGYSLREAVANIAGTMAETKGRDLPYACFAVSRIANDGEGTLLAYEMPAAILISAKRFATVLPRRPLVLDRAVVHESSCYVEPGEALLLMSDGISQAGMGTSMAEGWGAEGVCRYVNGKLAAGFPMDKLPASVHFQAQTLSEEDRTDTQGDDCTVVLAQSRSGRTVNLLTGPPADKEADLGLVRRFMELDGQKVICGGTTAKIVARHTHQRLSVREDASSLIAPPDYVLRGVDLATEGAVTLNQVFNIFDEDPSKYEKATGVTRLCELLRNADRVAFLVGKMPNAGHDDIAFTQRGILHREVIVPLLIEKLNKSGKLVTVEYV